MSQSSIVVENLDFTYGETNRKILSKVSFSIESGSRCLLLGRNGTGKSTVLRIIAGKHYINDEVLVLGRNAYHNTPIGLTFLGGDWAHNPNVRKDIRVSQLLASNNATAYPERRARLVSLLDIDENWRMHQVSDGERRRVQLLLGLVEPFRVLLLDEVTIDLDVLVRQDLLRFLREETEQRGATIVYATHILDGLNEWPTHLIHLNNGTVDKVHRIDEIELLKQFKQQTQTSNSPLLQLAEVWLRKELEWKRARDQQEKQERLDREKGGATDDVDLRTKMAYSQKNRQIL